MLKHGDIVKSIDRPEEWPLFLMVLYDNQPMPDLFKAVVLIDLEPEPEYEIGVEYSTWHTDKFVKTNWIEIKNWI